MIFAQSYVNNKRLWCNLLTFADSRGTPKKNMAINVQNIASLFVINKNDMYTALT